MSYVVQVQSGFSTHGAKGHGIGGFGELCNRSSACHNPNATWYNRGSGAFYCSTCGPLLNRHNPEPCSDGRDMCIPVTKAQYDAWVKETFPKRSVNAD
jgi:hypothetical protein